VASALTAETVFEIMKCISDVDMPARGRMGSKCEIFMFFNSGYAHDRNTGWAKKTGPFLNVDNFAIVSSRKVCEMSKVFANFV